MNLVLSPRYSDDARILSEAAARRGWKVIKLTTSTVPDGLKDQACCIYAEGFLAEHLAQQLNLELLRPPDDALTHLEAEFLQRKLSFVRKKDFERPQQTAFMKPADQKLFAVGVYEPEEAIPGLEHLHPDDPILISDPVAFSHEYRFFVKDRQVITGSIYLHQARVPQVEVAYEGKGDAHWEAAKHFATRLCQSTSCPVVSSFVLDVGLLSSGRWAIIEFNPTWASGIYGSDPFGVLSCLEVSQKQH